VILDVNESAPDDPVKFHDDAIEADKETNHFNLQADDPAASDAEQDSYAGGPPVA
jgi:hypothetical protein